MFYRTFAAEAETLCKAAVDKERQDARARDATAVAQ
jgi:hypothetical protein